MRKSEKEWIVGEMQAVTREVGRQLLDVKLAVAEVKLAVGESKAHPFDRYSTDELIEMVRLNIISTKDMTDYVKGESK